MTRNITDQRFGRLVALKPTEKRYFNAIVWELNCDCGNVCYKTISQLKQVKSCGCLGKETKKINTKFLHSESLMDTNIKQIKRKIGKNNNSGCKGVCFNKRSNRWDAYIAFRKKRYTLGSFKDKNEAIRVRKQAEEMMFEPFIKWYEELKQ